MPLGGTGSLLYLRYLCLINSNARTSLCLTHKALHLLARMLLLLVAEVADLPIIQELEYVALKVVNTKRIDSPGLNGQ